jgi:predicted PurR-regulated permease PerM
MRRLEEVFSRAKISNGSVLVALIQGFLGGLIFWWLGLPAPVFWGLVMSVLAVVPNLGAFVVWLPASLLLFMHGDWKSGLFLAVWGAVVISLIDNLLYPLLVGGRLRLHTLPTFIAIVGGMSVFGTSGLILGPATLAVTLALVDIWRHRTADGRSAEEGVSGLAQKPDHSAQTPAEELALVSASANRTGR